MLMNSSYLEMLIDMCSTTTADDRNPGHEPNNIKRISVASPYSHCSVSSAEATMFFLMALDCCKLENDM